MRDPVLPAQPAVCAVSRMSVGFAAETGTVAPLHRMAFSSNLRDGALVDETDYQRHTMHCAHTSIHTLEIPL